MQNQELGYYNEAELEHGAELTAVSYDRTQSALVTSRVANAAGKPVTAEISGLATAKGEDGTVNLWLSSFRFKGRDGVMKKVPGVNAVAKLHPRQGAIDTAKAIASYVNASKTAYKATASGSRKKALINIAFTGKNCLLG